MTDGRTSAPPTPALLDWYVAHRRVARAARAATPSRARGAVLVAAIEGDYLNVVGLPLARLLDLRPDLLPPHTDLF